MQITSTTTDLLDNSIGSITALHVFEHIVDEDLSQIGVELTRLLKPGGRILAVMPDLDGRAHAMKQKSWSAYSDPTHINLKGASEWMRFFEERWGFDVVASFADGYYDFPYGVNRFSSAPADAFVLRVLLYSFYWLAHCFVKGTAKMWFLFWKNDCDLGSVLFDP